jgi:hypothetical protein
MKKFALIFIAAFGVVFAGITAKNGIQIGLSTPINGKAPNSAINGIAIAEPAAGEPGIDPTEVAGLQGWYNVPIAGAVNNTQIADWPDSSGNGFTMDGPANPQYKTSVTNGQDAVEFNNVSSYVATSSISASTYPFTFIAVVYKTGGTSTIFGPSASDGIQFRIDGGTGNLQLLAAGIAFIAGSSGNVSASTYTVVAARVESGTYKFWINTSEAGNSTHSVSLSGGRTLAMGISQPAVTNDDPFGGQILSAAVFNTAVSDSEVVQIITRFKYRFGIP